MKKTVLILAGGKGLRMGSDIPKQFLQVGGKPVLLLTMEAFRTYDPEIDIILVLPEEQQEYWKKLCVTYDCAFPYQVADGGETRFHSVKNGLALAGDGLIAVHDGVRPFVSQEVIASCFETAERTQAAVPVVPVLETLRFLTERGSETVPRSRYRLVQTPQVFSSDILKQAYEQVYVPTFTDDASVVEAMGIPVSLVEGNRENIKITTPFDLVVANALIECSI